MISRSIAMPSARSFYASMRAINSASAYEGSELVVSNNSGDFGKHKEIISHASTMLENFKFSFENTNGDFVLIMGDDDRIFSLNDREIEVANDVIGIQPHISAFTTEQGIIRIDASPITADTGEGRIDQYHRICQGLNLGLFTFWRRDILADMLDLWCNHHPTKGAYADWAFMRGMVSSGRTVFDPSTVYFKNIDNWYGDQEKIDAETKKLYRNADLPEEFARYDSVFKAIDSYIFVARKNSPLKMGEKKLAASKCLAGHFFGDITETLQTCGLLEKYKEFHEYATGYAYGDF